MMILVIGIVVMAVSMIRGFESDGLNRKTLVEYFGGIGVGAVITFIGMMNLV